MTPKNPYRATGIGSAYIEREADQRLRRELADNRRYPFIAASADSGKTALLRHTASVLDPSQYCVLVVDLARIRPVGFTQFIGELLTAVAREGDLDKREIHPEAPEDTFLAWLGVFPQRFLVMLDGFEALRRADFLPEFLGKLRFLHNVRAENREFSRLQVVLAGSTHIAKMVPVGLRSPFGGAQEIWLRELSVDQVESLAWSLSTAKVEVDVHVGAVLHRHTGGIPFLCQHVLGTLWDEAHGSSAAVTARSVNRVIEDLLDRAPSIEHFARIFRTVSTDSDVLDAFARTLRGETVEPERQLDLRVSGLVGNDSPYACNLYEQVFGPGGPLAIPLPSPGSAAKTPIPAAQKTPTGLPPPPVQSAMNSAVTPNLNALEPLPPAAKQEVLPEPSVEAQPELAVETKQEAKPEPKPEPAEEFDLDFKLDLNLEPKIEAKPEAKPEPAETKQELKTEPVEETKQELKTELIEEPKPELRPEPAEELKPEVREEPKPEPKPELKQEALAEPPPPAPPAPLSPGHEPAEISGDAVVTASSVTPNLFAQPVKPPPAVMKPPEPVEAPLPAPPPPVAASPAPPPPLSPFAPVADSVSVPSLPAIVLDEEGPTQVDGAIRKLSSHTPKSLPPEAIESMEEPTAVDRRREVVDVVLTQSTPLLAPVPVEAPKAASAPHAAPPPPPAQPAQGAVSRPAPSVVPAVPVAPVSTVAPTAPAAPPRAPAPASTPELPSRPEAAAPAMATSQPLTIGVGLVLANRYFLTCEIGQGPVATVWNAYDRIKDEQVALKLMAGPVADNPQLVERFWRSAQQMAALSHPAIVGVLNKPREENGTHYVVMEYLSGDNLRQWVLLSKLTRAHLLRVLQRLAAALQYAHERRTLHRNIKPSNILFDSTGHARLSDVGLVWPADATHGKDSRADRLIYMAPEEQLGDGQGDARSDVYSLGMCALFALHGKELSSAAVTDRAKLIESLEAPAALKAAIKRAVAPNPGDRFATAAEFSRALDVDAPALPGISARHNISSHGERTPARGMAAASAHAPAAAPPAGAKPAPSTSSLPKLSMPEPLFKSPDQPAEGDDLQPPPGRNPGALAEYRIETERIHAIQAAAAAARSGTSLGGPPPPPPPATRSPWMAMIGVGALVLIGGGIAAVMLAPGTRRAVSVGTTVPANPVQTVQRPVVEPLSDPTNKEFVPTPVIPLKTDEPRVPAAGKPTAVALKTGEPVEPPPSKPVPEAKGPDAKPAPEVKVAEVAKPVPEVKVAETKPVPEVKVAETKPVPEVKVIETKPVPAAKVAETKKPLPEVKVAEVAKPAPEVKVAETKKPLPEVKVAAVKETPEPPPAAKTTAGTKVAVVAKPAPIERVVAGTKPAQTVKAAPAAKPAPAPRVASAKPAPASRAPDPASEKMLNDAQDAFRRGERQTAISMALRVTQRGGPEAAQAWRFVGQAACSTRAPELATSAYRNIRVDAERRMVVDICGSNGLRFSAGKFTLDR